MLTTKNSLILESSWSLKDSSNAGFRLSCHQTSLQGVRSHTFTPSLLLSVGFDPQHFGFSPTSWKHSFTYKWKFVGTWRKTNTVFTCFVFFLLIKLGNLACIWNFVFVSACARHCLTDIFLYLQVWNVLRNAKTEVRVWLLQMEEENASESESLCVENIESTKPASCTAPILDLLFDAFDE